MGKSQKKKSVRRHNPVRVPDSHLPRGLASAESTSSKTEAVLPIIQKMGSSDPLERKWACVAVSNLIQNDPSTRRLLQGKNVVGSLITRLSDGEEEVVVEAAGALRNLCIDGGFEICAEMYNKNILAPLRTFLPKISAILEQFLASPKDAPENANILVFQLSESLITILWCLSETSNKALNSINEITLIPFLMSFLAARDKLALAPVIAAAQCLYVLTDENYPAIKEVNSNADYLSTLLSIIQAESEKGTEANDRRKLQLKVLAAGVLKKVSPFPTVSAVSSSNLDRDVILPVLQPIVTTNVSLSTMVESIPDLVVNLESEPKILSQGKHGPKSDHKSEAELELDRLENHLRTIQLALEILTDASATLPEPVDAEGETGDDGEWEEMDGEEEGKEVEADADGMNIDEVPSPSSQTLSSLPTFVPPLLSLIQPTALSFPPLASPSIHPPTTSALSSIHLAALECLNNIFLSLAVASTYPDGNAGASVWKTLWEALELVGTETSGLGQERRAEFWSIAAGVLWGVASVWKGLIAPTDTHVHLLVQLCNSTTDERLRVRCVGTLECLAQHPASIEMNKVITQYLLSILNGSTLLGTEPFIQATSALIDIFSDENMPYDINFRSGGYLNQLIDGVDRLKAAIRTIDRKKEGGKELRRRGEETKVNLVAFVQYRRSLRF